MTPTEQDKELRKEVYKHLEFLNSPKSDLGTEIDHIMQLITADRERVALEARIDELRKMSDLPYVGLRAKRLERLGDRVAELKAQQEEV